MWKSTDYIDYMVIKCQKGDKKGEYDDVMLP